MLSPELLEKRRHYVTATDVPRLFGIAPPAWGSAADVYLCKVCEGMDPIDVNPAMQAGNFLEPSILAWAEQKLGNLTCGQFKVHAGGIVATTLDAETKIGEPVEAKSHGICGFPDNALWGAEGTDEIPEYYLLQVHTQILVTGAARAYVPALIGGRGFCMYEVNRNEDICTIIQRKCEAFWRNNVEKQIPPTDLTPSIETLKRIRREPGKVTSIPDDLVADWNAKKELAKAAAKAEEEAKSAIIAALSDAEAGIHSGGMVTYYEQTRKGYMVNESSFRVLRNKAL